MTNYIITELPYSDSYLEHWGIPGMKWGVRRFQNEDRTWTPEGKIRYGRGGGERRSNDSESVKSVRDSVKDAIKRASTKIERKISGSEDHQITRKKAKDMSDEELRTAMVRLNAEKTYRDLYDTVHRNDQTPSKVVKSIIRPVANVMSYAGDRFTKGAIDKLLEVTLNNDAYNAAREMREINLQNARLNQEKLEDELAKARVLAAQRLTREEAAKLKEEEQQTAEMQRKLDQALLQRKLDDAEDVAKINDEAERQARRDSAKALNEAQRELDKALLDRKLQDAEDSILDEAERQARRDSAKALNEAQRELDRLLLDNKKRDAQDYRDSRADEAERARLQREADSLSKQWNAESDRLRVDFAKRMADYARMPETTQEERDAKRQAYTSIKSYSETINDFINAGKGSLKAQSITISDIKNIKNSPDRYSDENLQDLINQLQGIIDQRAEQ